MTSIPATKSDTPDPGTSGMSRATKVRWAVAVFCAVGLAINYIDRSAISVSLPFMTEDFHLTPTEKGLILSAFSWSYALMQIPAVAAVKRDHTSTEAPNITRSPKRSISRPASRASRHCSACVWGWASVKPAPTPRPPRPCPVSYTHLTLPTIYSV